VVGTVFWQQGREMMNFIGRKRKEGSRFSKRLLITGITAVFVFIALIALLIINISSMDDLNLEIAVFMGENKLKGDMTHFTHLLNMEHGDLRLKNGELIDEYGVSLAYRYDIVDHLSGNLGIEATILVKENDGYRRIATSIVDLEGNRVVDTFMEQDSAAYAPVQSGLEYLGNAVILGRDYLTMYHPVFQPGTNEVIGVLFAGLEMAEIRNIVTQKNKTLIIPVVFMRAGLIALGALLAVALVTILVRSSAEKNKADERMRIMFNAMPLGANIHNKNFDYFDCNDGAVRMFGLSSKKEFRERFLELWPEYQPNGELSSKIMAQADEKAFNEGYCHFEWTYKNLKGELIPGECTLVRVKHNNEFVLVAYMRDLRELKLMMKEIEQRERLLNTVNSVAGVLLSINDEKSFEAELPKSFELVGRCLDLDRVQIWRNEVIDGELHYVHRYEWLSDFGRDSMPVPIGLHFSHRSRPDWDSLFLRGEYLSGISSLMPEDDHVFLDSFGIKSIVIIPMFLEGVFWGFFGINDCHKERAFSEEEIHILTSVGLMMSNAINRSIQSAIIREADERMQLMFDATPLCMNFWDKNINNIDCNQEAVKMFDLSSKKEYSERFHELSPEYQPDGRLSKDKAVEYLKKAFETGYSRFEWMHRKLDGELIPCDVILVRVEHKNDFIVVGYARDLRELKAMLGEIQRENEKSRAMAHWYNSILNAIPLPITVTDADSNWTFINMAVEKHLGITLEEALGKQCSNWNASICNTEDCGIARAKRGLDKTYFSEGDSSYEVGVATLKDLNGTTMGYVEVVHDITSLKLMAKKQADAEAASHILENILNGIDAEIYVSVPHKGELLFVNDYMKKKNNLEGDITGRLCYKVFIDAHQEGICDFCPCYKLDKDPHNTIVWEYRIPTNRVLRNATRYIEWTDGRIVQIQHSVDVTELITAKEQAIQANKDKSSFLAKMSHEIRTPMNAILGITEIYLQNEELPYGMQEALDRIYNSGYLLLGIINDILDLSKIEAGKMELTPAAYDVPSLINDTVHLNVMRFDSKPIEFNLHVAENIPSTLYGDELRIKQILNNLLSNAFKYTDKGEVSLSVAAEYAWQEDSGHATLVFRVSDTGQGMTAEQVDKLFDEYTRFNTEANRETRGTGLGMAISKQLIRMMDGEISVESEPDEGSVFTVRLQQGIVGASTLGREAVENLMQFRIGKAGQIKKAPQIVREYMPYGKVLIVDDVESNLYVARGLLAPYGLEVETAISGFETIEKIKGGATFDIIFMDHYMPKMDGIEAVKIIRGLGYARPIVALTANALAGQAEMFMENGFEGFISKPIDIRQLNLSLNKLIRDKQPPEALEAARRQALNVNMSNSVLGKGQPPGSKLAAIFSRDAEKALARLGALHSNEYRRTDDMEMFVINVHAMKSALANIGETELSAKAGKLEQAGRSQDIKAMMAGTPEFLEALRIVIEKNKPNEDEDEAAYEDSRDDLAYLGEKLLAVQKACGEYDKKTVKTLLAELEQKKWPRSVRELLDGIAEHLLHSNFDEIVKLARDYAENKAHYH
jgi:PAS domain S-box-containing protein